MLPRVHQLLSNGVCLLVGAEQVVYSGCKLVLRVDDNKQSTSQMRNEKV